MTIILPAFRCGRAWERAPLLPGSTLQSQQARASLPAPPLSETTTPSLLFN
jgi:hypothetical protein